LSGGFTNPARHFFALTTQSGLPAQFLCIGTYFALGNCVSRFFPLVPAIIVLLMAAPVEASSGAVPEPSDLALFLLGLVGVIVGRQSIASPRDRRPED
jgi:hypothetical protein